VSIIFIATVLVSIVTIFRTSRLIKFTFFVIFYIRLFIIHSAVNCRTLLLFIVI
jgi:hypothetical protein